MTGWLDELMKVFNIFLGFSAPCLKLLNDRFLMNLSIFKLGVDSGHYTVSGQWLFCPFTLAYWQVVRWKFQINWEFDSLFLVSAILICIHQFFSLLPIKSLSSKFLKIIKFFSPLCTACNISWYFWIMDIGHKLEKCIKRIVI